MLTLTILDLFYDILNFCQLLMKIKIFDNVKDENIARIAKLPYGQRKAYWKKGFIERKALLKNIVKM